MTVSVVIPTHNRAKILPRTIQSVLRQTYRDLECIVVDDGSVDSTNSVVEELSDPRVRYFRHPEPRHVSAARNTGLRNAQGELIAFLDDDDEWLPTKLEKQIDRLSSLPDDFGLVYCWMEYRRGEEVVKRVCPRYSGDVFKHVFDKQRIGGGGSTLLLRRSVIDGVGGFDEALRRGNDGDFLRRVALRFNVDYVPEVLVNIYVGHQYRRISGLDERGIRNAIEGQKAKLEKFPDQLRKYPRRTANIYAKIGVRYGQLGEWASSIRYFGRAIRSFPFAPQIYRLGAATAWNAFWKTDSTRR